MSSDVVTGLRLLRALINAESAHKSASKRHGGEHDARWMETREALTKAQEAFDAFVRSPEDFKVAQGGER